MPRLRYNEETLHRFITEVNFSSRETKTIFTTPDIVLEGWLDAGTDVVYTLVDRRTQESISFLDARQAARKIIEIEQDQSPARDLRFVETSELEAEVWRFVAPAERGDCVTAVQQLAEIIAELTKRLAVLEKHHQR